MQGHGLHIPVNPIEIQSIQIDCTTYSAKEPELG